MRWSGDAAPAERYDGHTDCAMCADGPEPRIGVLAALVACSFLGFSIGCVVLLVWQVAAIYGLNP